MILVSCAIIITSWTLEFCVLKRKSRKPGGAKRHKFLAYVGDGKAHLMYSVLKGAGYEGWKDELEALPYRGMVERGCQRDVVGRVEREDGSIGFPSPGSTVRGVGQEVGNGSLQDDDKTPAYSVALLGGHSPA